MSGPTLRSSLRRGSSSQTITVTETAGGIDTTSTTSGGTITADLFKNTPVGRNITDIPYLIAGVNDGLGTGRANPSISGATGLENLYIVNGVNINKGQATLGVSTKDAGGEFGGYLRKNRLFWYSGFNAVFNRSDDAAPPNFRAAALGNVSVKTRDFNYSAKLNYNITANQNHQIEGSVFGDPSHQPFGPNRHNGGPAGGSGGLASDFPQRAFSELNYGSRNWSVRYNGAFSPKFLLNASFSWAHNKFDESNLPNIYRVQDRTEGTPGAPNPLLDGLPTPATSRGLNEIGGAGFVENTEGNNRQVSANATLTFRAWGGHQMDYGGEFQNVNYDWFHRHTGPDWKIPCTNFLGQSVTDPKSPLGAEFNPKDCGSTVFGGDFLLRRGGPSGFFLSQRRGAFTGLQGATNTKYAAVYLQDAWQLSRYITLKLGLRWEQQRIIGEDRAYSFPGNWAPRAGIIVDPWGNRKTKMFFNFGRFFEKIPQYLAVRPLSDESRYIGPRFALSNPGSNAATLNSRTNPTPGCPASAPNNPQGINSCLTNPANWILDPAHHFFLGGTVRFSGGVTQFIPGTKAQYQDEFVVGIEHEFRGGVYVSARYLDRRIRRIVENISGETVGAFNANSASDGSLIVQQLVLANPTSTTDVFHNTLCDPAKFGGIPPDPFNEDPNSGLGCLDGSGSPQYLPGSATLGEDGLPGGFPIPMRKYQAFEVQI